MFEEMERWMEGMLPEKWSDPFHFNRSAAEFGPKMDLLDREAEVVVRAAVPGFNKEDIEVSATGDSVTIRGKAREEHEEEEGEYYHREIRAEDFLRTVRLPCFVDDSKAKASFKEGMLEVVLPKVEENKRHAVKIE
jgi:HSP20 family protein